MKEKLKEFLKKYNILIYGIILIFTFALGILSGYKTYEYSQSKLQENAHSVKYKVQVDDGVWYTSNIINNEISFPLEPNVPQIVLTADKQYGICTARWFNFYGPQPGPKITIYVNGVPVDEFNVNTTQSNSDYSYYGHIFVNLGDIVSITSDSDLSMGNLMIHNQVDPPKEYEMPFTWFYRDYALENYKQENIADGKALGYDSGYEQGFSVGRLQGQLESSKINVGDIMTTIFVAPVNALKTAFNFTIPGTNINIFEIVTFLITMGLVVFVVSRFVR